MTDPSKWRLVYSDEFIQNTKQLDVATRSRLIRALEAIAAVGDPRSRGKTLTGPYVGLWRYRVGDWRVIVELRDAELIILALKAGHRSKIY